MPNNNFFQFIQIVAIVIYFWSFIINLNTGYYYHGDVVLNKDLIRKRYLSRMMLVDILVWIALFYNLNIYNFDITTRAIGCIIFLK